MAHSNQDGQGCSSWEKDRNSFSHNTIDDSLLLSAPPPGEATASADPKNICQKLEIGSAWAKAKETVPHISQNVPTQKKS